jgi:RNA polymerase sigma factor (sigma-70 family)
MRFDERLRILADAQGDPALLSLASVNLLLCDRSTREQEDLREALQVAAVPHWFNEEILAHLLEPSLSVEAEALSALLRRLPIVEPFPARGPGAINVHDAVRLALRTRMKDASPERLITLSARAQVCFKGQAPPLRIEALYHRFTAEPEAAERECATLYNEWYNAGQDELLPALGIVLDELLNAGLPSGIVRGSALYYLARIRYHFQSRELTVRQVRQARAEFERARNNKWVDSANELLADVRRGQPDLIASSIGHEYRPATEVAAQSGATRSSVVLEAAQSRAPEGLRALTELCTHYWPSLYAFARRRGHPPEDAQDLVQGFFLHLISSDSLSSVDRSIKRLRPFLLALFQNFVMLEARGARALKRGGRVEVVRLDWEDAEGGLAFEPTDQLTPETLYDARWALLLLRRATEQLQQEQAAAGKARIFEALKCFLGDDSRHAGESYEEAARALGVSVPAVKTLIHRLRRRHGQLVRAEVARTVSDPADVDAEVHALCDALIAAGGRVRS